MIDFSYKHFFQSFKKIKITQKDGQDILDLHNSNSASWFHLALWHKQQWLLPFVAIKPSVTRKFRWNGVWWLCNNERTNTYHTTSCWVNQHWHPLSQVGDLKQHHIGGHKVQREGSSLGKRHLVRHLVDKIHRCANNFGPGIVIHKSHNSVSYLRDTHVKVTGQRAEGKLLGDYWLPEMDISLIDSQHLCFADSVAQKLTPHFTYLESCCVFSHWLYYSRAFKARDERRFWRIINIPLTYHQVQKIQATATEKNKQLPPSMFVVDVRSPWYMIFRRNMWTV